MKVTATLFSLKPVLSETEFFDRIDSLIHKAKSEGSELIVFPEYFSLSYDVFRQPERQSPKKLLDVFEPTSPPATQLKTHLQKQAQAQKIWIVAGSMPHFEKKTVNRSWIFAPHGEVYFQDKMRMTRFEEEEWGIHPGPLTLHTFEIGKTRCAVLICFDSEFSDLSLLLAKNNIDLLIVPTCTDDENGYWRVRHCTQARCVENQLYAIHSCIVGGNPDYADAIGSHYGMAGVFTPCDLEFPKKGILAEKSNPFDTTLTVDLDFKKIQNVRKNGTVLNRAKIIV